MCMDLFLAGTETTSTALAHMLLYLVMYPEMQERLRQELHQTIGRDRLPSLEDAAK